MILKPRWPTLLIQFRPSSLDGTRQFGVARTWHNNNVGQTAVDNGSVVDNVHIYSNG